MGCEIWVEMSEKKMKILSSSTSLIQPFRILTITLLSLLLPLSFLLLARLSTANYLFAFTTASSTTHKPISLLFSIFLYTNPTLLHVLVSLISIAALIHGLTGRTTLLTDQSSTPEPILRSRLYTAWIFLCTLQICVGLGIEGSIAAGVDASGFGGHERSFLSRVFFFLGLHETMLLWSRMVVKPVVDDTVFGFASEERWVERVTLAASVGTLWWWRLRDEVESLVVVAEVKRDTMMGIGVADFVGWWLYYLTVTIGMVRVVRGLMWIGMVMLCRRRRRRVQVVQLNSGETQSNEEKV